MRVDLGLNAVIVAVTEEVPRILTVSRSGRSDSPEDALPFGPLEPEKDRTLDRALRRWVREQTGLELGYVEQLYTFGDRLRDPWETHGGPRVVSVAYLALVREVSVRRDARWRDWYEFFPWEDWRSGRPEAIDRFVAPALDAWVGSAGDALLRRERRQRADIVFGLGGVGWDGERVLERYELLYEAYLVPEAWRDRDETCGATEERLPAPSQKPELLPGRPMALDHRRILATALGRLRGKLKYRPVVFELLPPTFTLLQLQRVVEALAGVRLHKQNFRRLVENAGLVEGTGQQDAQTGGRPAELFVFRREVLRERPAPGVGLPGVRR
ncbi:MAG TPA: NUDIX domain-containing protein [Thermoanaerobaculia bacterium]|nr:NUDIX domain-containing protein [Thermoanaerobaculia bacterium]